MTHEHATYRYTAHGHIYCAEEDGDTIQISRDGVWVGTIEGCNLFGDAHKVYAALADAAESDAAEEYDFWGATCTDRDPCGDDQCPACSAT